MNGLQGTLYQHVTKNCDKKLLVDFKSLNYTGCSIWKTKVDVISCQTGGYYFYVIMQFHSNRLNNLLYNFKIFLNKKLGGHTTAFTTLYMFFVVFGKEGDWIRGNLALTIIQDRSRRFCKKKIEITAVGNLTAKLSIEFFLKIWQYTKLC